MSTDLRAMARVSWGRWVADCPRTGCPNAEHFGRDPGSGHVGGLTGSAFRCALCQLHCPAIWPENVDDIVRLLSVRPVPATRNWSPGETLHDLLAENVQHGILPEPTLVVGDRLAPAALTGGGRRQIGPGA